MATNSASQTIAVTTMALSNLTSRLSSSLVTIAGIAGVVVVFVGLLSIAAGFRALAENSGSEQVAILLRAGATDEIGSVIEDPEVKAARDLDAVARDANGAIASAESYAIADVPLGTNGYKVNFPLRGVTPRAAGFRSGFHFVRGRDMKPGTSEIIVGRALAGQFAGLNLGSDLVMGTARWKVVGIFADVGSMAESEIWADAALVQSVFNQGTAVSSLRVKLKQPEALRGFRDAVTSDTRINARVLSERQLYRDQSRLLTTVVSSVGFAIALLMGLGAIFSALNTMYSSVANRTREIATLRALGFGRGPVIASVLAEAALLGLLGGILGSSIAYLAFDGMQTSTLNFVTYSQIAFSFAVPLALLVQGSGYALMLGLIGGLLPSLRAARLPIADGLRAR
jgi:putative ABC transport system permease protein